MFGNQGEKLPVSSTTDGPTVITEPLASAGAVRRIAADTVGDNTTVLVNVQQAGQWNVRVGLLRRSDAGQVQLAVASSSGGFMNVGGVQEAYAAGVTSVDLNLGDFAFGTPGPTSFRFVLRVATKMHLAAFFQ